MKVSAKQNGRALVTRNLYPPMGGLRFYGGVSPDDELTTSRCGRVGNSLRIDGDISHGRRHRGHKSERGRRE